MIKQILYPSIVINVLRLDMTPGEVEKFEKLTPQEKAEFITKNSEPDELQSTFRELLLEFYTGLDKMELQKGICMECGCTEFDACLHPEHGECSWTDENKNLCSHCENPEIAEDPRREGPQGVKKPVF